MGGVVSASQPVAMPTNATQAALALRQLSSDYFVSANAGNTQQEQAVHAEAQRIRAMFPTAGPAGGYTQAQLANPQTWQAAMPASASAAAPATSSTRTIAGRQGYYSQSTYVAGRGWVYSGWVSTAAQAAATHQAAYQATVTHAAAVSSNLPVAMPRSAAQASAALRQLSSDYFAAAGNPQAQAAAHAEAASIRQQFPGTGPAGGYTVAQLSAAKKAQAPVKTGPIGIIGSVASGLAENSMRFLGGGGSAEGAAAAVPYAQAAGAAAAEATGIVAGAGLAAYGLGQIPAVQRGGAAASSLVNRVAGALTGSGSGAQATDHGIPAAAAGFTVQPLGSQVTQRRTAGNIVVTTVPSSVPPIRSGVATEAAGQPGAPTAIAAQLSGTGGATTAVQQAKKQQQGGGGFLGGLGAGAGRVVGTGAAIGGGAALIGGTPQGQAVVSSIAKDVGKTVGSAAKGIGQGASSWPWWLWLLLIGGGVVAAHELGA